MKKPGVQPNAELGDILFVDTNGDGQLDANDKCMIGNPIPDVYMALMCQWLGEDRSELPIGRNFG